MREQEGWDAHAGLMDAWTAEGFVLLGGPYGDGEQVLMILEADDAESAAQRLATDPWVPAGLLVDGPVEAWNVLLDHAAVTGGG